MSTERNRIKVWVEAMRLRTLPVSAAGVTAAVALSEIYGCFKVLPSVLCLLFAVLAQISSNFANEYFDYRGGLDRPGREGPRRGVTEGDIPPGAMLRATVASLARMRHRLSAHNLGRVGAYPGRASDSCGSVCLLCGAVSIVALRTGRGGGGAVFRGHTRQHDLLHHGA